MRDESSRLPKMTILMQGKTLSKGYKLTFRVTNVVNGALARKRPSAARGLEQAMNLHFVPTSAEAVLWGAHLRSEARGAHYCQDFEHESPAWQRTILYAKGRGGYGALERAHRRDPARDTAGAR